MDALALGADEGRGKRRYASGSCKQALIRGFPNGETRLGNNKAQSLTPEYIGREEGTWGSETSQYP